MQNQEPSVFLARLCKVSEFCKLFRVEYSVVAKQLRRNCRFGDRNFQLTVINWRLLRRPCETNNLYKAGYFDGHCIWALLKPGFVLCHRAVTSLQKLSYAMDWSKSEGGGGGGFKNVGGKKNGTPPQKKGLWPLFGVFLKFPQKKPFFFFKGVPPPPPPGM